MTRAARTPEPLAASNRLHDRAGDLIGPARLLRDLVRHGLNPAAMVPAAQLALALDQAARNANTNQGARRMTDPANPETPRRSK